MIQKIEQNYLVYTLFSIFVILCLNKTGIPLVISLLGLIACILGFIKKETILNKSILYLLITYNVVCMISSLITTKNLFTGYVGTQLICTIILILLGFLSTKEQQHLKKLSIIFSLTISILGILLFFIKGLTGNGFRLDILFDNSNVLGIFMVITCFLIKEVNNQKLNLLTPLVIVTLALTLSIGSIITFILGLVILTFTKYKKDSLKNKIFYFLEELSNMVIPYIIGILMYISINKLNSLTFSLILIIYLVIYITQYKKIIDFFKLHKKLNIVIFIFSLFTLLIIITLRNNFISTFLERVEMIIEGINLSFHNPIVGIGPLSFNMVNALSQGKYFNTYYIHNLWIHNSTELGILAAILLVIIFIKALKIKKTPEAQSGLIATTIHYFMDVGFMYLGITTLLMILLNKEGQEILSNKIKNRILIIYLILFITMLIAYI